jgi:hypothetical protein
MMIVLVISMFRYWDWAMDVIDLSLITGGLSNRITEISDLMGLSGPQPVS